MTRSTITIAHRIAFAAVAAMVGVLALIAASAADEREYADDAAHATALTLTINGVEPLQGAVAIGVYQGQEAYGAGDALATARIDVTSATVTVLFEDLAPGDYAIKLYHDVDGDGVMNTNAFGFPTEPFAFSNSARGTMGAPAFSDAVFELAPGANEHTITMP